MYSLMLIFLLESHLLSLTYDILYIYIYIYIAVVEEKWDQSLIVVDLDTSPKKKKKKRRSLNPIFYFLVEAEKWG